MKLLLLKPDEIKELAKSKRLNFNWPEHYGDGENLQAMSLQNCPR